MGQPTPRDTVREREVFKWYKRNYNLREIGDILDISRQRVWAILKRASDEGRIKLKEKRNGKG